MLRLAFAGTRADRARVAITAFGAATAVLILLCAATVLAVQPDSGRYHSRMFSADTLLSNLAFAMILFTVPALFFVGQCARLGAPARDRRLAAFRLAGASPAQVVWVAAAETGVAASAGALLGTVAFLTGRVLLDDPGPDGTRGLPTDVLPATSAIAGIAIGVPLLATALTIGLLRRVAITPFGLVRASQHRRVRAWPGLLGLVGLLGFTALEAASRTEFVQRGRLGTGETWVRMGAILICTVLLVLGLMLGTAWIGHVAARLLLRLTKRPSALIAARRILADPYDVTRTYVVIQVVMTFGGAAMMLHAWLVTDAAVRGAASRETALRYGGTAWDPAGTAAFRSGVFELVNGVLLGLLGLAAFALLVVLVESGVARRRTLAALVAAGTPRAVLARAQCWHVLIPTLPGIALASLAGMLAMRSFTGTATGGWGRDVCDGTATECADPAFRSAHSVWHDVTLVFPVPLPWADVAALAAAALLVVLTVIGASLLLQRSSTNPSELRAD
ncbi:FtsX-like permease family protein [Dactylosporangium salmoneum]